MNLAAASPADRAPIVHVLQRVRAEAHGLWIATTLCAAVGAAAISLAAVMALDAWIVLPGAARALALAGLVAATVIAVRWCWRRRPDGAAEEMALLVERHQPALDNLLINALQLSHGRGDADPDPAPDPALVDALVREAGAAARTIRPARAVPRRAFAVAGTAAALGAIALLAFVAVRGGDFGRGLHRLLLPFAGNSYTQIVAVSPGSADVLMNDDVMIVAHLAGRVPTEAELVCDTADGRSVVVTMRPVSAERPDRLTATLPAVRQSLRYEVAAGDDLSDRFELRVHERPVVERIVQSITPPDYLGARPTEQVGGTVHALAGSSVTLEVLASQPLAEARLTVDDGTPRPMAVTAATGRSGKGHDASNSTAPSGGLATRSAATAVIAVDQPGSYAIELVSDRGFASLPARYDIVPRVDQSPTVRFLHPETTVTVGIEDRIRIELLAADNFGLHKIRLVQLHRGAGGQGQQTSASPTERGEWTLTDRDHAEASPRIELAVAELVDADLDEPIVLQAMAWDWRPDSPPGLSRPITLQLRHPDNEATDVEALAPQPVSLTALIERQRENITAGERTLQHRTLADMPAQVRRQEAIRSDAVALAAPEAAAVDPASQPTLRRLGNLARTLMVVAVEQLRRVEAGGLAAQLESALETEREILKQLIAADVAQDAELAAAAGRAIAERLAAILAKQKTIREQTDQQASPAAALSTRQRVLSREMSVLERQIMAESRAGAAGNGELATTLAAVAEALRSREVRGQMLIAAEQLAGAAPKDSLPVQDRIIADLIAIQQMLSRQALAEAREEIEAYREHLADARDRVETLTELQRAVTEVARQLEKTKDLTEGEITDARNLMDLEELREQMVDAVEQLAKDLHLMPDPVASNDLIPEMNEIFEDVQQAAGSENDEPVEIAVDRDEGVLEALREMQEEMGERVADLEMWLGDRPDSAAWKQEAFDKNELGEIPLGDLPEALEDLVGDLLEKSEQLEAEAQDAAGNTALPDPVAGWQVADGPMPSWGAKGKSGNDRPNKNEQTGRSGSGRQGASVGETVGDTIKNLEGQEVETRRTNDAAQAGELKEEPGTKMDTKATGGGKLAGVSDREGMRGEAPARNEMKYRDLARQAMTLKNDAQTVYSKARLMRMPTGDLDRAALELDAAARRLGDGDVTGFARAQARVVRALKDTRAALTGSAVVEGVSAPARRRQVIGAVQEPIPEQYEQSVAEYMRTIARSP